MIDFVKQVTEDVLKSHISDDQMIQPVTVVMLACGLPDKDAGECIRELRSFFEMKRGDSTGEHELEEPVFILLSTEADDQKVMQVAEEFSIEYVFKKPVN